MFQGYCKLLTNEHNKELTVQWLKENMKYQRYENAFSHIMSVVYLLDVEDQIAIIKEMLLNKRNPALLNTYFKIINDHHLDIKKYLDEIQIYNNNEDYIMEMIRYYMNNQQIGHAKQYYKEHIQNIRTKETKAKLESLLNPENEDAYLNYLCSKLSYYNCSEVPIYYDDLKEFYGNKFENYLIYFIDKVDHYYSDYELALMFKRKQEAKYVIYILLQKPNMNFFDPLKGMIKEYSLEMYLMVYVECLKDYINQGIRNYYLSDYILSIDIYVEQTSIFFRFLQPSGNRCFQEFLFRSSFSVHIQADIFLCLCLRRDVRHRNITSVSVLRQYFGYGKTGLHSTVESVRKDSLNFLRCMERAAV